MEEQMRLMKAKRDASAILTAIGKHLPDGTNRDVIYNVLLNTFMEGRAEIVGGEERFLQQQMYQRPSYPYRSILDD